MTQQSNWKWAATEDASSFPPCSFLNFDAVVLLSTTEDVFNESQQLALRYYLRSGRALLGALGYQYRSRWMRVELKERN